MTRPRRTPSITIEPRQVDLATTAAIYGVSEEAIRQLIAHHDHPSVRVGSRVVVPVAAADRWWAERCGQTVQLRAVS